MTNLSETRRELRERSSVVAISGDMLCGPDGGLHIAGWFGGGRESRCSVGEGGEGGGGGGGTTADLDVVIS